MRRYCTLLTDFGEVDPYVGCMKGVLVSKAPGVQLIDLSHQITPQDVFRGSLFWADALPWFPAGTVHLGVIDPGVGTKRRVCVAEGEGHILVCPDNGLLSHWWHQTNQPRAFEVNRTDLFLTDVSSTFHGRDIFSPVAAALVMGVVRPEDCGPPIEPVLLEGPVFESEGEVVKGSVLLVDHFGNCVMNIPGDTYKPGEMLLLNGNMNIPRVRTYGDAQPGEVVILEGSTGLLEIAVVQGSAARHIELTSGSPVTLQLVAV